MKRLGGGGGGGRGERESGRNDSGANGKVGEMTRIPISWYPKVTKNWFDFFFLAFGFAKKSLCYTPCIVVTSLEYA